MKLHLHNLLRKKKNPLPTYSKRTNLTFIYYSFAGAYLGKEIDHCVVTLL